MLTGSGNGVVWSKPAALVCHICGREYGTTSLKIHLPQCEKMWIEREKLKDRKDRRPVPKALTNGGNALPTHAQLNMNNPDAMTAYNEAALKQFNDRVLLPCPNCARTFFEDRLAIHLRSCRPGNEAARVGTGRIQPASEAVAAATPMKQRGPGQTYGAKNATATSSATKTTATITPTSSSKASSNPPAAKTSNLSSNWEDDMNAELDLREEELRAMPSKSSYSLPPDATTADNSNGSGGGDLAECSFCQRHFNSERLAKHEAICRKQQESNAKRHKVVDSKQSTSHATASSSSSSSAAATASEDKNSEAWRAKHTEFASAIQYAKKLTALQKAGVPLKDIPPPPRSENPDYVQCPHCERRFNPQAAERHIPACANTINKPKGIPKSHSTMQAAAANSLNVKPQAGRQISTSRGSGGERSPASGGGGGSSGGGSGGFGSGEYGARPGSSGGLTSLKPQPPRTRPLARPATQAQGRSPSSSSSSQAHSAVDADLHEKISQLTATVAHLSKVVLTSPTTARGGSGGAGASSGITCRSCGEVNPVATAKFCPSCGCKC